MGPRRARPPRRPAHVASPFGGQGSPAAVEDAVALHRTGVEALDRVPGDGPLPEASFAPFEERPRPSVAAVLRTQRREEKALPWYVRNHRRIPTAVLRLGARAVLGLGGPPVERFRTGFALDLDPAPVSLATEHLRPDPRGRRRVEGRERASWRRRARVSRR